MTKVFFAIGLKQVDWDEWTGKIKVVVKNSGAEAVTLSEVYVNELLDSSATISTHPTGNVWTVTFSKTYPTNPEQLTLKVVTSDGAFSELTMQPPNEFWN